MKEEGEECVPKSKETTVYEVPFLVKVKNKFALTVHRYRGLLCAFAAAWCFAGMTMTVSALTDEVGSMQLVFVRAFATLCLSTLVLIHQGQSIKPESLKEVKFHIINAVVSSISIFCQFYAYQNMRTADASAIIYGYVAFTGLFGRIFLKEAFGFFEAFVILFTFGGTVFIARPPFIFGLPDEDEVTDSGELSTVVDVVLPPLVALCGSIFGALMVVTLRAMQNHNFTSMKTVFYFSLYSVVIVSVPLTILQEWTIPQCIIPKLWTVIMGCMAFAGYSLVNLAVSVEDAVYVSLVTMNEVYIVFFLDILLFGTEPRWLSVFGTFLIVGSSAVTSIRKILQTRKKGKQQDRKDKMAAIEESNYTTPDSAKKEPLPHLNGRKHSNLV